MDLLFGMLNTVVVRVRFGLFKNIKGLGNPLIIEKPDKTTRCTTMDSFTTFINSVHYHICRLCRRTTHA